MKLNKELSVEGIGTILSVIGAGAVLYARLCVVESKFSDSKDEIASNTKKIDTLETRVNEHDKSIVELKTLFKVKSYTKNNSGAVENNQN